MGDENGGEDPRRQFSDEELMAMVREHAPAGTSEIAESLGVSRRAVEYRLRALAENETTELRVKKIGQSLVWYIG